MLNFKEQEQAHTKLKDLVDMRCRYTERLMDCADKDVADIVEILNEIYEGLRLTRKSLGHLKGIRKRRISIQQANKFRELYRDTVAA